MKERKQYIVRNQDLDEEDRREAVQRGHYIRYFLEKSIKEDLLKHFPEGHESGAVASRIGVTPRTVQYAKAGYTKTKHKWDKEEHIKLKTLVPPLFEKGKYTDKEENALRIKIMLQDLGIAENDAVKVVKTYMEESRVDVPYKLLLQKIEDHENTIRLYKRKIEIIRKLLNHTIDPLTITDSYMKERIESHGGMYQWCDDFWENDFFVTNFSQMKSSDLESLLKRFVLLIMYFAEVSQDGKDVECEVTIEKIIELIMEYFGNETINPLIAASILFKHAFATQIDSIGGEGTAASLSEVLHNRGIDNLEEELEAAFHKLDNDSPYDSRKEGSYINLKWGPISWEINNIIFKYYFFAPILDAFSKDKKVFINNTKKMLEDMCASGKIKKSSLEIYYSEGLLYRMETNPFYECMAFRRNKPEFDSYFS